MSIFSVADHVTAEEAARFYGLRFVGKRAFCPFHDDGHHPAMAFRGKSYHCFGCNKHGDAIDLVGQLLGVDNLTAARHINEDFNLGIADQIPNPAALELRRQQREQQEQCRTEVQNSLSVLCWAWRSAREPDPQRWEDLKPMHVQLLRYFAEVEFLLSELSGCSVDECAAMIAAHKKVVDKLAAFRSIADGAKRSVLARHQRSVRTG